MHLLVTGAAGFLGSAFCRWLLDTEEGRAAGAQLGLSHVTALDALTYAGDAARLAGLGGGMGGLGSGLGAPGLGFVQLDVCDGPALEEALRGVDAVVHLAAETHVDRSIPAGAAFARSNALGTQTLLDAAIHAGVQLVLAVSTDEVYGGTDRPVDESAPLRPSSAYAASKAAADLACRAASHTHGLDVRVTRAANAYGPWQHPEKLIPHFTTRLLRGLPVPLYGDGLQRRCWLHATDHARALAAVLLHGRPGGVYNLPGRQESTNAEVSERLVALCHADPALVHHVPDRLGHDRRYLLDGRRVADECGWAPTIDLSVGLAETVEWYRSHAADIDRLERRSEGPRRSDGSVRLS